MTSLHLLIIYICRGSICLISVAKKETTFYKTDLYKFIIFALLFAGLVCIWYFDLLLPFELKPSLVTMVPQNLPICDPGSCRIYEMLSLLSKSIPVYICEL